MFGSRILKSQNSPEGIDRLREALDKVIDGGAVYIGVFFVKKRRLYTAQPGIGIDPERGKSAKLCNPGR